MSTSISTLRCWAGRAPGFSCATEPSAPPAPPPPLPACPQRQQGNAAAGHAGGGAGPGPAGGQPCVQYLCAS